MAVIRENAIVQHASGTAANWTSEDPTLDESEWGYETDTKFLKIGDGSTAWTSLGYTFGATSATVSTYATGWINRSDWTNVHLGTVTTKDTDSNLNHALNAPLAELLVRVFVSTDGTDANSFQVGQNGTISTAGRGYTPTAVDDNNIIIQTADNGLEYFNASGGSIQIDAEDWYYKIVVYKLA